MKRFKIGDVVKLKSGGPEMTVVEHDGEFAVLKWFGRSGSFEAIRVPDKSLRQPFIYALTELFR